MEEETLENRGSISSPETSPCLMAAVKATLDTRKGQRRARADSSAAHELRRAVRAKRWGTIQPGGEVPRETEVETTQKSDHWAHWEPTHPSPFCSLSSSLGALRESKGKSRLTRTRTDVLFCPPLGPRAPETQATSSLSSLS